MLRQQFIIGAALAVLSLAGPAPARADSIGAADFVSQASISDRFMIHAAKIAAQRSANPKVKNFAAMVITDHTKSLAALKNAVAKSGRNLVLSPMTEEEQDAIGDLNEADAEHFDKAYLDQQVDAHGEAEGNLKAYANKGAIPSLKAYAARFAPIIQAHADRAAKIRATMP
jgi:putative membrane protein